MAALHEHVGEDDGTPYPFRHAVDALRGARVRSEVLVEEVTAPRRLAAYAYALEATVLSGGEELADGRVVLLHEPRGHEAWAGSFRLVTLARADLEPEMAGDPLLPEVSWSWLTGALASRGAGYDAPSGTVSRASSHFFGGLADRPEETRIELRASWTPREHSGGLVDAAAHLTAWCDLLCACAGLPPGEAAEGTVRGGAGVLPLPKRRG